MEQSLTNVEWRQLMAAAARAILGEELPASTVGGIRLLAHQADAVPRIEFALQKFGGALLADDVGLGKTFVALAVAARRQYSTVVAAPASLRQMWLRAMQQTGVHAAFVSLETLSLRNSVEPHCDLLIVDEAHQLRNPRTMRYRRVASAAQGAHLLLLSATPVHNRESELRAVLALFMGARATAMDADDLAVAVIRRERSHIQTDVHIPPVVHRPAPQLPPSDNILDALMALPPAAPTAGGGDGGVLVGFTLIRQWASSFAALVRALRRRLSFGTAMLAALEDGLIPTAADLSAWCASDDAIQLPLFGLLGDPSPAQSGNNMSVGSTALLAATVNTHLNSVREILAVAARIGPSVDDARWNAIRQIVAAHPGEKTLVFSQFAETARAMFNRSLRSGRSGLLTSDGAVIASGRISRDEMVRLFAPRANGNATVAQHSRVDLLFSTDLLSEGTNLQDASVLVHLDTPWTPVRLAQREGRLARPGSAAEKVTVYTFPPPAGAESLLRMERRLAAKLSVASRTVGVAGTVLPLLHVPGPVAWSIPQLDARIRSALRSFLVNDAPLALPHQLPVASVRFECDAQFLALIEQNGEPRLVLGRGNGIDDTPAALSQVLEQLMHIVQPTDTPDNPLPRDAVESALLVIRNWQERREAHSASGLTSATSARARASLLRRISVISGRTPPHQRPRLLRVAARARSAATLPLGHGAEEVLAQLANAPMSDDAWLRAIECFVELRKGQAQVQTAMRVNALLIFRTEAME